MCLLQQAALASEHTVTLTLTQCRRCFTPGKFSDEQDAAFWRFKSPSQAECTSVRANLADSFGKEEDHLSDCSTHLTCSARNNAETIECNQWKVRLQPDCSGQHNFTALGVSQNASPSNDGS